MCGIAGFLGQGDDAMLSQMCATLARRGPDDHGTYVSGAVGLSQARLSIIDLSEGGHQPMKSGSGRTVITYNGEIYNYRELKQELAGSYAFKSESDTEVILALYEAYGEAGFSKLDGMFAIALYDSVQEALYLVRDRLGKKPLYWGIHNGTLLFASELKALMRHESFRKEIDRAALEMYVAYEYIPTPHTIFKNTYKVPPASYVRYVRGTEPVTREYWSLPKNTSADSYGEAIEKTDTLLARAVEKRLVSDVPLGVFLSGGIDSSTVAYYAAQAGETRTFSIGFDEPDFDESAHARTVAEALGTVHTEEIFSASRCMELVSEVFSYLDEPIADASILPTYLLAGFTRQHVTVALGGDGGDEVFAGYPTFQAEQFVGAYNAIPTALRRAVIEPAINALPTRESYMSIDFRLKKFLDGASAPVHERHQKWLGAFVDTHERSHLLSNPASDVFAPVKAYVDALPDSGNGILWSYVRTYLMDEVLVKADRASMAHGLEVRAPLLDTALLEYVFSLPYSYKFKGGTGKRLLKSVMHGKLPQSIIDRKKKGFGIPLSRWLRYDMNALMHELLSSAALKKSDVFSGPAVQRLIDEHESGTRDNRKKLWTLMVFQMWHNAWIT